MTIVDAGPATAPFKSEGFGNPWLSNIHEVATPDAISLLPSTPLWWALIAGLLVYVLIGLYERYCRWQKNSYRRAAISQLQTLKAGGKNTGFTAENLRSVPTLIRQVAMVSQGRNKVVTLTGAAWLVHLNTDLQQGGSSNAIDVLFLQLGYLPDDELQGLAPQRVITLLELLSTWVRIHTGEPC